jgi:predicted nicotinamide N-methyase
MHYPIKLTPINENFSIYIPDYEQVKEIYECLLNENSNEPFPYWAKLWPSTLALVQFVNTNSSLIKDKTVLEIGAGIGLPSLLIAGKAKSIQVTDYALDAVELMHKNIAYLNLENVQAFQLDWNKVPKGIKPEILILSDVNYNPNEFDALIALIKELVASGTLVILSTPQRIMASPFVNALQQLIQQTHVEIVAENEKLIEISILVLNK